VPALIYRTRPDVVLLDYHLPRTNGLVVCRSLKSQPPAPAVLLYSAYADASLVVPAIVAGADGIAHKGSPARELFDAIRTVAHGDRALPPVSPDLLGVARDVLDPADRPILDLLVDHVDSRDIAGALRLEPADVPVRIARMLDRLKVPVP
jgi:DNA-binding NarL/FixJ family response regulator